MAEAVYGGGGGGCGGGGGGGGDGSLFNVYRPSDVRSRTWQLANLTFVRHFDRA